MERLPRGILRCRYLLLFKNLVHLVRLNLAGLLDNNVRLIYDDLFIGRTSWLDRVLIAHFFRGVRRLELS
jgi:hypothetical protein